MKDYKGERKGEEGEREREREGGGGGGNNYPTQTLIKIKNKIYIIVLHKARRTCNGKYIIIGRTERQKVWCSC